VGGEGKGGEEIKEGDSNGLAWPFVDVLIFI